MEEKETTELTVSTHEFDQEGVVCPFTRGRWKKVGDALVFFMLFIAPILYLVVFLITR